MKKLAAFLKKFSPWGVGIGLAASVVFFVMWSSTTSFIVVGACIFFMLMTADSMAAVISGFNVSRIQSFLASVLLGTLPAIIGFAVRIIIGFVRFIFQ